MMPSNSPPSGWGWRRIRPSTTPVPTRSGGGGRCFLRGWEGVSRLAEGLGPLRMVALSAPVARRESPDIDSDSLLCREGDVMTKRDLIDEVNKRFPHLSRRDSEVIINAIFDSMVDALAQGDRIE